jgi:two-component system sensor histidine kinase DesK
VTHARRPAHGYWFALFGAHSDPKDRLLCIGTALVFLAFPISDLLSGRLSGGSEVVAAAGLAAFAALYLRLFWIVPWVATERRAEGAALLAALASLAIGLSIAFGDEWLGLLVYVSVALALALPTRLALAGVAAVAAAAIAITGELDVAVQAVAFGLILVAVRRLMELVRELEAARRQVAELAASEERLRLSRDMHDLLGHNLSVIALKSQLARKLLVRDPTAAESEVRDIESVARTSLQEARAAVRGLRSASLDSELGRAKKALEAAGIEATVYSGGALPAGVETLLGFAAREGVTNVIRHSRAGRCEITVRGTDEAAELEVRDDGAGAANGAGEGSGLAASPSDWPRQAARSTRAPWRAAGFGCWLAFRSPAPRTRSPGTTPSPSRRADDPDPDRRGPRHGARGACSAARLRARPRGRRRSLRRRQGARSRPAAPTRHRAARHRDAGH